MFFAKITNVWKYLSDSDEQHMNGAGVHAQLKLTHISTEQKIPLNGWHET